MTTITVTAPNSSIRRTAASVSLLKLNVSAIQLLGKATLCAFLSPVLLLIGLMRLVAWASK